MSDTPKKKTHWFLKYGVIGFGLGLIGAVVGPSTARPSATTPTSSSSAQASPQSQAASALEVTASELWAAYNANEVRAQAKYGGKLLAVTGTIASVDLDYGGDVNVKLDTGQMFQHAQVDLGRAQGTKDWAGTVEKGQAYTFRCARVIRIGGSPLLSQCQ